MPFQTQTQIDIECENFILNYEGREKFHYTGKAIDKLAEYENTNLSPEEVEHLKRCFAISCAFNEELKQKAVEEYKETLIKNIIEAIRQDIIVGQFNKSFIAGEKEILKFIKGE